MVKERFYMLFYLMVSGLTVLAQPKNDSIFNAETLTAVNVISVQQNRPIALHKILVSSPLYLFIFLSPECPLSQNYTRVLNKLAVEFGEQVSVIGVFPGRAYPVKTIRKFVADYKVVYPVFIDREKQLTNNLFGTVTPEVILLNKEFSLVYKGAIDNLVKDLGEKKFKATQHYLKDAIEQSLLNKEISVKRTTAVGCLINDF